MPDITGRLHPPRLTGAPASPALGEVYFDTTANKLYWWNGTNWIDAEGAAGGGGGSTGTPALIYLSGGNVVIPKAYKWTQIPMTGITYDDFGNTSYVNAYYTCPKAGYYIVSMVAGFSPALANQAIVSLWSDPTFASGNGIAVMYGQPGDNWVSYTTMAKCNAGDPLLMAIMAYDTQTTVLSTTTSMAIFGI